MFSEPKKFLIWWNNNFPLDRAYRKKYNIAFNSEEHKKVNQIDVILDMIEDELFEEHLKEHKERQERYQSYEKEGNLFQDLTSEEELERYNKFIPEDPKRLKIIDNNDSQPSGLG